MKKTIIPAGYRIVTKSWENDGDFENTTTINGLSKSDADFYVDVYKLFTKSYHESEGFHGNLYDPSDIQMRKLLVSLNDVAKIHSKPMFDDGYIDILEQLELLGMTDDQLTRVVEDIKIEFIPVDIEIEDVTDRFL